MISLFPAQSTGINRPVATLTPSNDDLVMDTLLKRLQAHLQFFDPLSFSRFPLHFPQVRLFAFHSNRHFCLHTGRVSYLTGNTTKRSQRRQRRQSSRSSRETGRWRSGTRNTQQERNDDFARNRTGRGGRGQGVCGAGGGRTGGGPDGGDAGRHRGEDGAAGSVAGGRDGAGGHGGRARVPEAGPGAAAAPRRGGRIPAACGGGGRVSVVACGGGSDEGRVKGEERLIGEINVQRRGGIGVTNWSDERSDEEE